MIRFITFVLAVAALVFAGRWMDRRSKPPVVHASRVSGSQLVHATGRVEGASRDVELRFEIPGRLQSIHVQEGDIVEEGDVLMNLEESDLRHQLELKRAEWKLAKAQLTRLHNGAHEQERLEAKAIWETRSAELRLAQQILDRTLSVREKQAFSQQEIDKQRGNVDALTFQVAAAKARWELLTAPAREDEIEMAQARCNAVKAQVDRAECELKRASLRAPSCGVVAMVGHEQGELTGPTVREPAIVLIDTRQLRVRAFVEEQDVWRVAVGQDVVIDFERNIEEVVVGTIHSLSPRMSRKQAWSDQADERFDLKTREIVIDIVDPQWMLPGLSVDVEIKTNGQSTPDNEGRSVPAYQTARATNSVEID